MSPEPMSASDMREPDSLLLQLEGFEGPLDLLLDLARAQKFDLAKISILALVEQYLAEIEGARLRDLSAMRAGAVWLSGRPQLGREVFARGAPEDNTEIDRSRLALDLGSLVRAYLLAVRRQAGTRRY